MERLRQAISMLSPASQAVVRMRFLEGRKLSEIAEALDLSVRVFNSLKRTGITTVGDVLDLLEKGDTAVMSIRNFGEKSLDELRQKMVEKGYLKDDETETETET